MTPTLSIVIPAYNAERFIEDTIRSVTSQTYADWELIVVDNASKDRTGAILEKIVRDLNDPRIRILCNPDTLSMAENWNVGIQQAKGKFIKLLCADDMMVRDCMERQIKSLEANQNAVLSSGARVIINSKGKILFKRSGIRKSGLYSGKKIIRTCIMSGTNIIGDPVNVMWRSSVMEQVGIFNPTVLYCTDVEYWLRILSLGDLYYDSEPVGFYRIHGKSTGTGLVKVTVKDFLQTAQLQVARGTLCLSKADLFIITLKSFLQSRLRQCLYRLLG